jgi:riboflavin synthase
MFTGIIEQLGEITAVRKTNGQLELDVTSDLTKELKVDQSLAHNGICLTITDIQAEVFTVCAVQETMNKTTINNWQKGELVNLERGMKLDARLDGHIVQGHVDTVGKCIKIESQGDNKNYTFLFDSSFAPLIVEKGSIVVNGVSLTCFNVTENSFQVTIIPYTFENTTFKSLRESDKVNLEFDILGKYFQRHLSLRNN